MSTDILPDQTARYYYSYLPSLILDHDLDFTNQYAELVSGRETPGRGVLSKAGHRTSTP